MGYNAVSSALPRGGPPQDEYPAHWGDYLDGRIENHWILNKAKNCTISEPEKVSEFVR
jgi:hypothetical protein